jgi:hypothetical protein
MGDFWYGDRCMLCNCTLPSQAGHVRGEEHQRNAMEMVEDGWCSLCGCKTGWGTWRSIRQHVHGQKHRDKMIDKFNAVLKQEHQQSLARRTKKAFAEVRVALNSGFWEPGCRDPVELQVSLFKSMIIPLVETPVPSVNHRPVAWMQESRADETSTTDSIEAFRRHKRAVYADLLFTAVIGTLLNQCFGSVDSARVHFVLSSSARSDDAQPASHLFIEAVRKLSLTANVLVKLVMSFVE